MKLLVDIGNSRIKWTDSEILSSDLAYSCSHSEQHALFEQYRQRPDAIWVANVAGKEVERQFTRLAEQHWRLTPTFLVSKRNACGVENGYADYARLGIDRWVALLAAHDQFHKATLVVDCGSATTLDMLDAGGKHLGGLILPGIEMMRKSLLAGTSIPAFTEAKEVNFFAIDTSTGIESGAVLATVTLIERAFYELSKRIAGAAICVITGGAAMNLIPKLTIKFEHVRNLVLQGVALAGDQETR